eukprot:9354144-Alexandrium_andersonii.AAC.1
MAPVVDVVCEAARSPTEEEKSDSDEVLEGATSDPDTPSAQDIEQAQKRGTPTWKPPAKKQTELGHQ